jgi:periplasmic divalent cation tolerance protein
MNIVVLITTKDVAQAKKISRALLAKKLIACANIVSGVQSFFWWQGKLDSAKEALMVIKTRKSCFAKLVSCVKTMHSYQVPEIIALPIAAGNKEYLQWLKGSCEPSKEK